MIVPKPHPTDGAPIRCLVIQLARLGDTIQTLMALKAAKQLYPRLEIHLLVRETFAAAAARVPWIDELITLPTKELLGPVISGTKSETDAIKDLARWVAPLVGKRWDLVANWSFSEASSYLTALLPAHHKIGFTRRDDFSLVSADGWSQYIHGVVQANVPQNIHLTDILTTQLLTELQIHYGSPADAQDAQVTGKNFFTLDLNEDSAEWPIQDSSRKWIGIQLGAGQSVKTWDPAKWAKTATYILNSHPDHHVVFLGGTNDLGRAKEVQLILQENDIDPRRVLSLVGETDFSLWASVVGRCQWIFAGDTSVIHLASVLGTRVLNVSVGPVRWSETGPYGNGHYVVSASRDCTGCASKSVDLAEHSCSEQVSAEAVFGTWLYANQEWTHQRKLPLAQHFAQLGFVDALAGIQIFRSRIRESDDGGGVIYEPALRISEGITPREWLSPVVGHIARAWYCGWTPSVGQELNRAAINPSLIQSLRLLDEAASVLERVCGEGHRTALELLEKTATLRSDRLMDLGQKNKLKALGKKLADLDGLVDRLAKADPTLEVFSNMSRVLMHNLNGNQLSELGRESAEVYRQLQLGVQLMRDWIQHTLGLARPVAIERTFQN